MKSFEVDAERSSHVAASPVGPDQPSSAAHLAAAVPLDCDLDAGAVLAHLAHRAVELQLEGGIAAQQVVQDAGEPRLLALHPVGVAGCIGDGTEIERGQHPMAPAAILEPRSRQSLRDQRRRGAELVEHVEGRRVEGRGAQLLAQVGTGLEHRDRHAVAHETRGRHQSHRPGAGDQDAFLGGHVGKNYPATAVTGSAESPPCG